MHISVERDFFGYSMTEEIDEAVSLAHLSKRIQRCNTIRIYKNEIIMVDGILSSAFHHTRVQYFSLVVENLHFPTELEIYECV